MQKSHNYDHSYGVSVNYLARIVDGTAVLRGENCELELQKGDLFFIPMGLKYRSFWSGENIGWDSVGFTLMPSEARYPLQKMSSTVEADELFERLYADSREGHLSVARIYTLIELLLAEMESDHPQRSSLVDRATKFMLASPELPLPEIARLCTVSTPGLYAAFRALGTTPVKVRLEAQVKHAVMLLTTTDLTTEAIAEKCGFGSVVYFYRVLKRFTGKTSRDFRRREVM